MNKAVRTARTGFTLIELLVVIAIIAILAAILFPVFAKAREKARQTSCLSQTKQIGLAILQYLDNYDEKLPAGTGMVAPNNAPNATGVPQPGQGFGWAGQIYSQVKSVGIFKCPDDPTSPPAAAGGYTPVPLSYGYNSNVAGITQAQFGNVAKSIMAYEIQNVTMDPTVTTLTPENYSFASDGNKADIKVPATYTTNSGSGTAYYATGVVQGTTSANNAAALGDATAQTGRHSDGSNFLLADGHSKWFRQSAVSAGTTNATNADCGTFGVGGTGLAANTACSTAQMGATFSAN